MLLIKKIMESRLFWYYIKTTSKPYSSSYYSLNGNYINNFGICNFTNNEIDFVLNENNKDVLDAFLKRDMISIFNLKIKCLTQPK